MILLTNDLMFSSRVTAAAARIGQSCRVVSGPDDLIAAIAAGDAPLVIIDLTVSNLNVAATIEQLRALPIPPRAVIAYGPHVHEARLAAAREAGCDEVFSRGAFNSQLDAILARYQAGADH